MSSGANGGPGAASTGLVLTPAELRARRRALGLSQADLANELGTTSNTVARWERAAQRISDPARVQSALEILETAGSVKDAHSQATAPRRAENLPLQLSSFVGRRRDMASAKQLLSSARLLTVTGSGGIGKTRLALEVAREVATDFTDGVWVVELAPLTSATLVARAVAAALSVAEKPGQPLVETLCDVLRDRTLLLVLDNCEHLIDVSAEFVVTLLSHCQWMRVLATSRESLGVPGEVVWQLPPLGVPSPENASMPIDQNRSEAMQLFVERARAALPGFESAIHNLAAVAEVCRRLDGIPLALELAAARVTVLTVQEIAARLDDRFDLLTAGSRVGPERHKTLRATLEWSYELLTAPERLLFDQLSQFAGGWTLEAATAVTSAGSVQQSARTLDLLGRLVAKSLVVAEPQPSGQVRYRFLETLRQFAAERLAESGDTEQVLLLHAQYFCGLAVRAEAELVGEQAVSWLNRLDADHENLRLALRAYMEHKNGEAAQLIAGALWRFWYIRGYLEEGWTWISEVMVLAESEPPTPIRANVLFGAAMLAYYRGEHRTSEAVAEKGLALSRRVGERAQAASFLAHLGKLARMAYDFPRARALLEEALAEARSGDWQIEEVEALINLARLDYFEGKEASTRSALEHALAISIRLSYGQGIVQALRYLGEVAYQSEDPKLARSFFEASVAQARALGDRWRIAWAPIPLGYLLVDCGEDELAAAVWRESLLAWRDLGNLNQLAFALEGFAYQAAQHGDLVRGLRLAGAAAAARQVRQSTILPEARVWLDRWLPAAKAELPETRAANAWGEGESMSVAEAIACALAVPRWRHSLRPTERSASEGRLTRRELEVVQLIAEGARDRTIAATLVISDRTTHAHVRNILSKLGFQSRVQVAAWAARQELPTRTWAANSPRN